ncbi:MAG: hypothetical protein IKY91_10275 [Akkermansia sp.]|nr:hypothetical protein [Akkermansia sp.]
MKFPDLRDFGLSPKLCAKVQNALQPGELVRWVGQPVVRHFEPDKVNRVVGVLFFLPFGLIGAALMYFLLAGRMHTDSLTSLVLCWLMAIVFFMVPIVACIIVPQVHAAGLRNTAYVITNRRAVVCGQGTKSWPLAPGMVISNQQAKDGCGNLVFSLRPNEDHPGWVEFGFMDIRDVRLVEEILEKAISERENA